MATKADFRAYFRGRLWAEKSRADRRSPRPEINRAKKLRDDAGELGLDDVRDFWTGYIVRRRELILGKKGRGT